MTGDVGRPSRVAQSEASLDWITKAKRVWEDKEDQPKEQMVVEPSEGTPRPFNVEVEVCEYR